ncbi:MAG: hypothetical protein MJ094_05925 [Saccharofermentans sp.]|nr:hypothetical protein [Saccharofermentans sp.]
MANFDWWSNDMMITDMMYDEHYSSNDPLLRAIAPTSFYPDDYHKAEGLIPNAFINNEVFDEELFYQYTSNIVIQRYLYRLINSSSLFSHSEVLQVLYFFNCFFAATTITVILFWIKEITNTKSIILIALLLAFLCPYFAMYGKNLYWLMWVLFMPIACMCVVVINNRQDNKTLVALTAYFSCLIKQLVCFEFISTIMISMIIPLIFYCIKSNKKLKGIINTLLIPFCAAILSFITAFGIRTVILLSELGLTKTIQSLKMNIGSRLLGTNGEGLQSIGPIRICLLMTKIEFISFKGLFCIDFFEALILLIILSLTTLFITNRNKLILGNNFISLLKTTWISVLAPYSWFVLAAPHTTIHSIHCSINWFIPFAILFLATFFSFIEKSLKHIKTATKRQPLNNS